MDPNPDRSVTGERGGVEVPEESRAGRAGPSRLFPVRGHCLAPTGELDRDGHADTSKSGQNAPSLPLLWKAHVEGRRLAASHLDIICVRLVAVSLHFDAVTAFGQLHEEAFPSRVGALPAFAVDEDRRPRGLDPHSEGAEPRRFRRGTAPPFAAIGIASPTVWALRGRAPGVRVRRGLRSRLRLFPIRQLL